MEWIDKDVPKKMIKERTLIIRINKNKNKKQKTAEIPWTYIKEGDLRKLNPHVTYWEQERKKKAMSLAILNGEWIAERVREGDLATTEKC